MRSQHRRVPTTHPLEAQGRRASVPVQLKENGPEQGNDCIDHRHGVADALALVELVAKGEEAHESQWNQPICVVG